MKRGQSEWFKQHVLNNEPEVFANEHSEPDTKIPSPASVVPTPIGAEPTTQSTPTQSRHPQQTNLLPRPLGSPKEICAFCDGRPEEGPFHDCRRYTSPTTYGTAGPVLRERGGITVPDNSADNARIEALIRDAGYADAIVSPGRVSFNCKEISFQQWAKEHGLA